MQAVDTDGSGEISIEEFKMFYSCLGLSEEVGVVLDIYPEFQPWR